MNILKKNIAPITENAWKEIKEQSDSIFKLNLTARKFVDIEGPTGLEKGGVSTGRLILPDQQQTQGVYFGIREILPFIEIRVPFELNIWELDNLERGAKDIDLKALEETAKMLAEFENNALYKGFKKAHIEGLESCVQGNVLTTPEDPNEFLQTIGAQIISLEKDGINGPYTLVINDQTWRRLINLSKGYPILKQLKDLLGGQIILNHSTPNSYLVSERGGDFELTIGQDISIGYDSHTAEKVKLYFTESFTFRVLSPDAIRLFKNKN